MADIFTGEFAVSDNYAAKVIHKIEKEYGITGLSVADAQTNSRQYLREFESLMHTAFDYDDRGRYSLAAENGMKGAVYGWYYAQVDEEIFEKLFVAWGFIGDFFISIGSSAYGDVLGAEKMSLYFASKWYAAKRRESIKYEAEEKILPILTQAKNNHINVAPGSVFDVD